MKRMMVTYKVKADQASENARYVRAVFAELFERKPAGLRYASFQVDGGPRFVHIVSIETDDGANPLLMMAAFKAFSASIRDRCEVGPESVELHEIGAYCAFGGRSDAGASG